MNKLLLFTFLYLLPRYAIAMEPALQDDEQQPTFVTINVSKEKEKSICNIGVFDATTVRDIKTYFRRQQYMPLEHQCLYILVASECPRPMRISSFTDESKIKALIKKYKSTEFELFYGK